MQREFLDFERAIFLPFVSQEEVFEAVVLTISALLYEIVLHARNFIDDMNGLLRQGQQERKRTVRQLNDCWKCLTQRLFTLQAFWGID
jgi:Tat protein secretion system quality control protein TatD with DNase activity